MGNKIKYSTTLSYKYAKQSDYKKYFFISVKMINKINSKNLAMVFR